MSGLHDNIASFMTQLKTLPKGSVERGKFVTSHMSHPPFLASLQSHPQGKQMHQTLMGFLNSKQNAGPQNAKVTVSKSESEDALFNIRQKIQGFSKVIKDIRERELNKSLIPTHVHFPAVQAGGGIEDVSAAKQNPNALKKKTEKSEGKAMKCAKCKEMHEPMKKCGEVKVAKKSELVDAKGKLSSNSVKTPMPKESKVQPAEGSGGQVKALRDRAMKKSLEKAEPKKMPFGTGILPGSSVGGMVVKAATPPMAKPPSGVNMNTKVPTSAPKAPKMAQPAVQKADEMEKAKVDEGKSKFDKRIDRTDRNKQIGGNVKGVHRPVTDGSGVSEAGEHVRTPSDWKKPAHDKQAKQRHTQVIAEQKGMSKPNLPKSELEKGFMSEVAQQSDPASASRAAMASSAASKVKLPGANLQSQRANSFSQAASGAFQPKGPISSGLELDIKPKMSKPGIFGKLGKNSNKP